MRDVSWMICDLDEIYCISNLAFTRSTIYQIVHSNLKLSKTNIWFSWQSSYKFPWHSWSLKRSLTAYFFSYSCSKNTVSFHCKDCRRGFSTYFRKYFHKLLGLRFEGTFDIIEHSVKAALFPWHGLCWKLQISHRSCTCCAWNINLAKAVKGLSLGI